MLTGTKTEVRVKRGSTSEYRLDESIKGESTVEWNEANSDKVRTWTVVIRVFW